MTLITDGTSRAALARDRRVPQPSLWTLAGTAVGNLAVTLLDWQERARQRRQLLGLDSAALKDFGRNLADASQEGGKPFWRT
jgi:uncharacterized protein YjiS (DUF1127 family)